MSDIRYTVHNPLGNTVFSHEDENIARGVAQQRANDLGYSVTIERHQDGRSQEIDRIYPASSAPLSRLWVPGFGGRLE